MELKRVIMKIKTKMLDFLPVAALILWTIINISPAFFYTFSSTLFYHVVNIGVNVIGVILFWVSIKYHNKYLESIHKERKMMENKTSPINEGGMRNVPKGGSKPNTNNTIRPTKPPPCPPHATKQRVYL